MLPIHVSPKHKIIGVPDVEAVRNLFPDAPTMDLDGATHRLVPHEAAATYLLRKLGYDAPAPILTQYEFPGFRPAFDVQKKTCALMTLHQRAYVLNGMGTGKTAAALWAYDYLRGNGMAQRLLVVAPLSTLTFTWAAEIFKATPHLKYAVLHGTKAKRLERLAEDVHVYIVNHDGVKVIAEELERRADIDTLVLDELAVYRNKSDRTKVIKRLAARMTWVWGLTGAPIPNSPTDAYYQASIVTPHTVPRFYGHFRDALMTRVSQFKFVPKPDAVEKAYAALQPAVRYTLDDVVELPDCVERTVDVEMGTLQAKTYRTIAAALPAAVRDKQITAVNAGAIMSKLLQISTGWVYTSAGDTVPLDNEKRIEALVDAVLATDHKVLVFVPFKHALAGISAALTKEGIEHATVSGDTPSNERAAIFSLFQNTNKYHCIAAHPQCLAHGITLTSADTIVWFAPVTSLEIYDQANARIRRVGQKHKQLYLHLQSTPVEKKIYTMLRAKQRVQEKLLELFEQASE
jgi:SNF2 family DNA or RNA helicase